ncbi:MAG: lactonase family protein [Spirochaetia bacterium]|nr:lactonase family protein [Spirochaetia bacterium]
MLLYSKVAVATNLYVVNNVTGSLSEYSIDRNTGLLTAIGSATGMVAAVGVQVDPLGRFVYVAATTPPRIHRFAPDASGVLSLLGTTTPNSTFPEALAFDPTGAYLYGVIAGNNTVEGFSVSAAGDLTSVGTAAAAAGGISLRVHPSGRFMYTTNGGASTISSYSLNAFSGAPTNTSNPAAGGSTPQGMALDPSGNFLYVANSAGTPNIAIFSINQSTGVPSLVTTINSTSVWGVIVDPTGQYVYTTNQGASNAVFAYRRDSATGLLTQIGSAPAGTTPYYLAIDPQSQFLYASNNNAASQFVSEYRIVGGIPVSIGTIPAGSGGYFLDLMTKYSY